MTRDEILPFVGKFVYVEGVRSKENRYFSGYGFLSVHRFFDFVSVDSFKEDDTRNENAFSNCIEELSVYISDIEWLHESGSIGSIPIHEYFGHELKDWLSKPIQQVSIDLNKYPHICRKCNSPAWVNPVTGHSDCSNKNCRGF